MLAPFFLDSGPGRILCTVTRALDEPAAAPVLVLLPPFAEEMNKSRHVMAQLGHRLARAGVTTVLPDLHGTGDSDGDFADADWDVWRRNAIDCAAWALDQGAQRLLLGGVRLGAALAVDVAGTLPVVPSALLLWQPVPAGRSAMTQFLRLRAAAGLAAGGERETTGALRERLGAGEALEVAGYTLSPSLFSAVESLDLAAVPPPSEVPVDWFEVSRGPDGAVLPAARKLASAWSEWGVEAEPVAVGGDAFWATQELAAAPALLDASEASVRARLP